MHANPTRAYERKPQRANAAREWMDGEIMKSRETVDRRMRRGLMGIRLNECPC